MVTFHHDPSYFNINQEKEATGEFRVCDQTVKADTGNAYFHFSETESPHSLYKCGKAKEHQN